MSDISHLDSILPSNEITLCVHSPYFALYNFSNMLAHDLCYLNLEFLANLTSISESSQVPLGLALTWAYAFLLTESKVYTYSGCSFSQRGSTRLTPECQQRMSTMLNCRTDVSNALSTSAWFRFPYPFQWGVPTFHWQTAAVMMVASVIASVDSVSMLSSFHS